MAFEELYVPLSPSVTPYLQFSIFNSSPSHPGWPLPTVLHFFPPKVFFVKRNPVSTLASLSTSRLIFVGKVSMLRGCERWRRKAKPRDQRPPQGHRRYKLVGHPFLLQEKWCLQCYNEWWVVPMLYPGSMKSMKPRYLYLYIQVFQQIV